MQFARMDKEFFGKQALEARIQSCQCVLLELEDESTECLISEAVFANDKLAGSITSAVYGYSVGKSLSIAFLNPTTAVPLTLFRHAELDPGSSQPLEILDCGSSPM